MSSFEKSFTVKYLIGQGNIKENRREEIIEAAEIKIKYSGYIDREKLIADKLQRLENISIENKFDYGITAGLGCEFHTKLGHFMIDGRYYFGLSDVFNNGKKDLFARSAHGTIIAKVTYLFDVNNRKSKD
jgi:hypothetical protein